MNLREIRCKNVAWFELSQTWLNFSDVIEFIRVLLDFLRNVWTYSGMVERIQMILSLFRYF
jgi:hypothetical protein